MNLTPKYKKLAQFLLILVSFYVLWSLLSSSFLAIPVDHFLRTSESTITSWIINLFGNSTDTTQVTNGCLIYFNDQPNIIISNACDGLVLFVLYSGVILAYPAGDWKSKASYFLAGNLFIYLINIIRIILLVFTKAHFPSFMDFNHHYLFKLFVYGFIFLLWRNYMQKHHIRFE